MNKEKTQISSGTASPVAGQNGKGANVPDGRVPTDEVLVGRCRNGDLAAFGQLIERHQDRLFNAVLRMVNNYDDAQELTQEAFFRALRGIRKFRGKAGFYTWLFRIGINLSLNFCRRRGKIHFTSLHGPSDELGHQADALMGPADTTELSPLRQTQISEEHQRVLQALEELEPRARAVVVLRDIEELDYRDIATILDVPVGTVKSRLSRARMALREQLIQ